MNKDEGLLPPEINSEDQDLGEDPKRILYRKTRRSLLIGGIATLFSVGAWRWAISRTQSLGLSWPLRNALDATGGVMQRALPPTGIAPEFDSILRKPARSNGDIGITDAIVTALQIETGVGEQAIKVKDISLSEITALPKVIQTIEFKCIEGWSEKMSFGGSRFSEFLEKFNLGKRSDGEWYQYVGLETPDGEYYVSIDMPSMLHPQTLLAYEMNGEALPEKHGAPLRLCISVKYGIKNLKKISKIRFADERPADYWHEQGYDWYASL